MKDTYQLWCPACRSRSLAGSWSCYLSREYRRTSHSFRRKHPQSSWWSGRTLLWAARPLAQTFTTWFRMASTQVSSVRRSHRDIMSPWTGWNGHLPLYRLPKINF